MREIVWSVRALEQYAAAIDYLAERNEPAASKLARRIDEAVVSLSKRPLGRPGDAARTYETIVAKTSYLLVFELVGDELRILRLFHMSQNWRGWNSGASDDQ